jgi:thiamine pyrophosphate-dependent acetolactate synthase large subunit-like protein
MCPTLKVRQGWSNSPGRIAEVLRLAFREMWNGRPGPVHVELPAPILYATGDLRRTGDRTCRVPRQGSAGL